MGKVPAGAERATAVSGPGGVYIERRHPRNYFSPRIQALKIATDRLLDGRTTSHRASSARERGGGRPGAGQVIASSCESLSLSRTQPSRARRPRSAVTKGRSQKSSDSERVSSNWRLTLAISCEEFPEIYRQGFYNASLQPDTQNLLRFAHRPLALSLPAPTMWKRPAVYLPAIKRQCLPATRSWQQSTSERARDASLLRANYSFRRFSSQRQNGLSACV